MGMPRLAPDGAAFYVLYDHNRPKSVRMAVPKGNTLELTLSDHQAGC
jgi:hypothetical protein